MKQSVIGSAEFPAAGEAEWLALAEKALAGADFEQALVSRTDDGIRIEPLSPRADKAALLPRRVPESPWLVTQRIDDPDPVRANRQALEDLAGGATGLTVVFEGAPNAFGYGLPANRAALGRALDGVAFPKTHLRIDLHPGSRASVDWLVALLSVKRVDPARLSLSFGIDPAAIFAGTGRLRMSIEAMRASMAPSLGHFFALGIPGVLLEADGRVYHNAGATEAQELGAMIASAVTHLRMFEEARQPLVYAAPYVGFSLGVDQDQFLSMAKIRALRRLWARVQEACSIPHSPATVHAETSFRMMARKDPETNILRTTIAAFAAAAGGADSLSVLPHTIGHGLPDAFARRIARNTQLVLAGESRLDFVADPASGSGAIEALTGGLCEKAWDEFRAIEAEGGIMTSLSEGRLQARVQAAREARAAHYEAGERAIVGTTLYPAKAERPIVLLEAEKRPPPEDGAVFCQQLGLERLDGAAGATQ